MPRPKAVRRFVAPTARSNEGAARLTLYSTRRREVKATPQRSPRTAQTAGGQTHEEKSHEQHT
jgi:hypothetical protein